LRDVVYDAAGDPLVSWFNFDTFGGVVTTSAGDVIWTGASQSPWALEVTGTGRVAVGANEVHTHEGVISDVDYSSLPSTVTPVTTLLAADYGHMAPIDAGATKFLVASPTTQLLYRWDGALWSDEQGSGDWIDPDLWGVGDTVGALDGVGGFYKLVNGVLSPRTGRSGIKRLWGSSATSFFAIDTTDVWHSNGSGAWTHEFAVPGGNDNRDVWADPTGDAVIVLGENGHISSRILGSWSDQTIPRNLTAVWGCDAHTAWITTLEGDIYNWTDGVLSLNTTIGGTPNLHAITGNSCGDLWVVGDNGVMYHGDGANWTDRTPVGLSGWVTTALAIRGPGQVIGVGQSGVSGLWSVAIQFRATPLPTQGKHLNAIWRMSNGEVIVAGDNVLLRGVR